MRNTKAIIYLPAGAHPRFSTVYRLEGIVVEPSTRFFIVGLSLCFWALTVQTKLILFTN